jgi:hypothetical protein
MRYFKTLPKVAYKDKTGYVTLLTNLLTRVKVIPSVFNNPLLYYTYDIKDSDTPEIIADKYYGDPYHYWVVLLVNEMQHPQWSWPLTYDIFQDYIAKKYANIDVNSIFYYEKIMTKTNIETEEVFIERVKIDEQTYYTLAETKQVFAFEDLTTVIETTKRFVTYYDYEQELNESKRNIKLLNVKYLSKFLQEFEILYSKNSG